MKLNEIRINNYFFIEGIERYIKVSSIFLSHFKCTDENGINFNNHQNNIKPIELTEEILFKCGFEPIPDKKYSDIINFTKKNKDFIYSINNRMTEPLFSFWIDDNPVVYFNYLHELQNLYFALTGDELEIRL